MDDEFDDADLLAALTATESRSARPQAQSRPNPPPPPRIQQPTPQRLDRPPPSNPSGSKVVQPIPQALPARSSGSTILVSPRQKGNPVLANLKSMPWEYSDIPADYGLGLTTCALFLSLKYHRLHPEYIYTRIRNLQGKYTLRIVLTMVDIPDHEECLRELSKTSLVNNVTVILCWSAAEAARYLELYKSYEHANFAAIKGQQSTSYAEKLVEFVTVPRSVNKADAVALVSTFGSLRAAINADPEQVAVISGWGEKKVKSWCKAVDEPFRIKKATKRTAAAVGRAGAVAETSGQPALLRSQTIALDQAVPIGGMASRDIPARAPARSGGSQAGPSGNPSRGGNRGNSRNLQDDEEAMLAAAIEESKKTAQQEAAAARRREEELSDGVAAALTRLREKG